MCLVRPDIVSISDYERRILNRFSKHIIQIPLGIDLNEEHWPDCWWNASRKREGGGEINVITTGRLEPNKVPLYILRSLDIVRRTGRRVKLHMLTARVDDLFLRKFISEVNRLGLQDVVRIIDASKMDRSTVFSMVAQADIALFPSYSESFGIAVLEYLYCGVPVVATRTGVAQYLESRGCLLAVDWGDVESMAEMILYASDMNKVERDRITRTARNLVEEEFNQQRFLQSFWNQIDRRYRQKCG
jgi:glycosyltransferase involved in cell wall biosynthesis